VFIRDFTILLKFRVNVQKPTLEKAFKVFKSFGIDEYF